MNAPSDRDDGTKGVIPEADRQAFKDRLEKLGGKLEGVKPRDEKPAREGQGAAMGVAFRLSAEMIAGVALGGLIGYGLDRWLASKPLALIIGLILGAGVGIYSAIRSARRMQQDIESGRKSPSGK